MPDDFTISQGLRAQLAARQRQLDAGARRIGWKAGFGTVAAMEKLGTAAPLVGFLTDATLAENGSTCSIAGWGRPVAEPEVAVRLGAAVAAGASTDQVAAAIDAVAPAIELADVDGDIADVEAILAGNIFHRAFALGEFAGLDPRGLADVRLDVAAAGPDGGRTSGIDARKAIGDLADVARRLAESLALAGERLEAGDVVITGAATAPTPLRRGGGMEVTASTGATVALSVA